LIAELGKPSATPKRRNCAVSTVGAATSDAGLAAGAALTGAAAANSTLSKYDGSMESLPCLAIMPKTRGAEDHRGAPGTDLQCPACPDASACC
jgi:hypothetical protein